MSKLVCRDVCAKYFGYEESVTGFSASFSHGINVIFGAQGSGKTTLLKAICGLNEASGDVFFDEVNIRDIPLKDRDFQMVFDDLGLFGRHSVRYNLEYPLKKRGVDKATRQNALLEAAVKFGLDVMIDAPVYRLTEWHKIALALCRVYLRKPKVVFIDNVFSCLDLCTRKQAFAEFMPLLANLGIVVFATDSISEAATLSKDIYFLNAGYLLQKGSVREILHEPSCASAFLSFNEYPSVLEVQLEKEGVLIDGFKTSFSSKLPISDVYVGKTVLLGALPMDFVLSDAGFEGQVVSRFYTTDDFVYVIQTKAGRVYAALSEILSVGDSVKIGLRCVRFLFDYANERRITRCDDEKDN